jgi:hypothetical protein
MALLLAFCKKNEVDQKFAEIREHYDVVYNTILVLENVDDTDQCYISYNTEGRPETNLDGVIAVHKRNRERVIYSINGLNALIEKERGYRDPTYSVEWEKYKGSIILPDKEGKVRIIRTRLYKKINFE